MASRIEFILSMLERAPQSVSFERFRIRECLKSQQAQWKSTVISELLTYAFTIWASWQYVSVSALFGWLLLACSATGFFVYALNRPIEKLEKSERWEYWAISAHFVTAVPWGIFTLLFLDTSGYLHVVWLLCIYTAVMSGSLATNISSQASYCAFVIGITIPFFIKLMSSGEQQFMVLGVMIGVYAVMMCFLAKNCNVLFKKSVVSSFENLDLVQKLSEEKEVAEKATRAKTQFLASASHDLRQPLNAINLFVGTLKTAKTKRTQEELIQKVDASLVGLNKMLHGLLDISKLDAEATENVPRDLPLSTLCDLLIEEYEKTTAVRLTSKVDDTVFVFADQSILYRVVRNVLDNAVKYTQEGEIEILAEPKREMVCLQITDTGIGIPNSDIESVFQEFKQLNNPERDREKGLGLGLAIVDRLSKIAGFKLAIESVVNHGTVVSIDLPIGKKPMTSQTTFKDVSNLIGKYVVVIDDEVNILDAMRGTLEEWGCTVLASASQSDAITTLVESNIVPDCIVSDLRLRNNENGLDAISAIRDEYNLDIPAILITGDTAPEKISKTYNANVAVMFKPIDVQQLRETLLSLIE